MPCCTPGRGPRRLHTHTHTEIPSCTGPVVLCDIQESVCALFLVASEVPLPGFRQPKPFSAPCECPCPLAAPVIFLSSRVVFPEHIISMFNSSCEPSCCFLSFSCAGTPRLLDVSLCCASGCFLPFLFLCVLGGSTPSSSMFPSVVPFAAVLPFLVLIGSLLLCRSLLFVPQDNSVKDKQVVPRWLLWVGWLLSRRDHWCRG